MFTVGHTTYNLRRTHMLTLSKPRKQWNALPDELRNGTFKDFKRRVQSLNAFD